MYDILASPVLAVEWGLPTGLVLIAGDGHAWIALDYRRGAKPQVIWIESADLEEVTLAPDFAAFIRALRRWPAD